jgi:hypothetical protein
MGVGAVVKSSTYMYGAYSRAVVKYLTYMYGGRSSGQILDIYVCGVEQLSSP